MSISTASISAADGLQRSQLATPPVAGGSAPGAASTARAASVSAAIAKTPAVQAAADAKAVELKLNARQVQQSLDDINKVLTGLSISVQFRVDPGYKELIVKVVDQDTGKLIRQIPTEEAVKISKVMDNLKGLLFAQSV